MSKAPRAPSSPRCAPSTHPPHRLHAAEPMRDLARECHNEEHPSAAPLPMGRRQKEMNGARTNNIVKGAASFGLFFYDSFPRPPVMIMGRCFVSLHASDLRSSSSSHAAR